MRPSFNTSGPCVPGEHYMLPPERRLGRVMELIDDGKTFTLLAAPQSGRTTCTRWLVDHYNAGDRFRAISVELGTLREPSDPDRAIGHLLDELDRAVAHALPDLVLPARGRLVDDPYTAVLLYLHDLSARCPRPLVVLFHDADTLPDAVALCFRPQIRCGFNARGESPFPRSMGFIGIRDVRDCVPKLTDHTFSAGPFNVIAEALTLAAFTLDEVGEVLAQHTAATGQRFEHEAALRIFELSQGHPWLVNAIADQIVERDVRDRLINVTAAHVDAAKKTIILERRTHIDALMVKLHEPWVRRIIGPMLAGTRLPSDMLDDEIAYLVGLGLIRIVRGQYAIANPIYREVIPRAFTSAADRRV